MGVSSDSNSAVAEAAAIEMMPYNIFFEGMNWCWITQGKYWLLYYGHKNHILYASNLNTRPCMKLDIADDFLNPSKFKFVSAHTTNDMIEKVMEPWVSIPPS